MIWGSNGYRFDEKAYTGFVELCVGIIKGWSRKILESFYGLFWWLNENSSNLLRLPKKKEIQN